MRSTHRATPFVAGWFGTATTTITRLQSQGFRAIVADANVASGRVLEVDGFHVAETRGRDERGDELLIYELELRPSSAAT